MSTGAGFLPSTVLWVIACVLQYVLTKSFSLALAQRFVVGFQSLVMLPLQGCHDLLINDQRITKGSLMNRPCFLSIKQQYRRSRQVEQNAKILTTNDVIDVIVSTQIFMPCKKTNTNVFKSKEWMWMWLNKVHIDSTPSHKLLRLHGNFSNQLYHSSVEMSTDRTSSIWDSTNAHTCLKRCRASPGTAILTWRIQSFKMRSAELIWFSNVFKAVKIKHMANTLKLVHLPS